MRAVLLLLLAASAGGCGRVWYHRDADRETYATTAERTGDPRWHLPRLSIDPPPESRLYDPFDPDYPPMPPDDPAANLYMQCPDGIRGYRGWHKHGDAPSNEDLAWQNALGLSEDGVLVLTPERAVELGLLHSREYQTALEDLYITALALTFERFEFALHWFGRNNTTFTHFGSGADETNTLTTASELGFTRNLAAGGQLLVDFANSFVFQFAGPDTAVTSTNLMINFVQPLLRAAGRKIRLEPLTQAERNLLYNVRDFARFRKTFYVNITTRAGGFLSLLLQVQTIRNLEANQTSLEQNLRMHEALSEAGIVSSVQVEQAFQSAQQARLALLQAQTALENSLDDFKTLLGLPPYLKVSLDDSLLAPFQLTDPALTKLQTELDNFFADYRELKEAPPLAKLRQGFTKLKQFQVRTLKLFEEVSGELDRWKKLMGERRQDQERGAREQADHGMISRQLPEWRDDLVRLGKDIDRDASALRENTRKEGWDNLQNRTRRQIALTGQLFILQTQVRVYLIQLRPVEYELGAATEYALFNRLDLMNQRARVVDNWRQITITANRLKSDLNVVFNASLVTKPGGINPVDFRSSASSYSLGFMFDGPLNRKLERNNYRRSLIDYERARRAYMALDDQIQKSIRRDLRQLETERLNFEIARRSLFAGARGVEGAREKLLLAEKPDESSLEVLQALSNLLTAKSTLIQSWVNYETDRMQLLLDLEALQLDERGMYIDEHDNPTGQPSAAASNPPAQRGEETAP